MSFAVSPRLVADSFLLGDLPLSRVLLMNDARYPWLMLVPRRPDLVEIIDLDRVARLALMDEIALASAAVRSLPNVDKINVGALGNNVRQLHVHVLGRKIGDPAWPGPVWGVGTARPYEDAEAKDLMARVGDLLTGLDSGATQAVE